MNKKIFSIGILLLGLFSISKNIRENKTELVFAEETGLKIRIGENKYDLPINIMVCAYDKNRDLCKTNTIRNDPSTGEYFYPEFVIRNADDVEEFKTYMSSYCYCKFSDEAINKHGDDAVSNFFIAITEEPTSYGVAYMFTGVNTKSGMEAMDNVIEVINLEGGYYSDISLASDKEPVISGIDYVYVTNFDNLVTEAEIRNCLTAIDDVDGDISDRIVIKQDNYTNKEIEPNETYSIIYQVSDSALNTAEFTIYIKVEDVTDPIVSGPSNLTSYLSNPIDTNDLIGMCSVEDNSGEDCSDTLTIVSDTYTENSSKPGKYSVTISAIDSSSNKGYKNIQITVIDDIKPLISGAQEYTKNTQATLTIKTITDALTATDNVDGDISSSITVKSDGYSDYSSTPGTYQIVYTVKDSSNNTSNDFIVKVIIKDGTLPIFYINSRVLNISSYEEMTHDEIIEFLTTTGAIKDNVENISFIYDTYTENSSTKGEYSVSLRVNYQDKTSEVINLGINVYENNEAQIVEETNNKMNDTSVSFIQRIINFINNIVAAISAFFSKITIWFRNTFA